MEKTPLSNVWSKFGGVITSLAAILVTEFLARTDNLFLSPTIFFYTVIVLVAFLWGIQQGIISSILSWLYLLYHLSLPGALLHYDGEDLIRVITMSLTAPAIAIMVGLLRRRVERTFEVANVNAILEAQLTERKKSEEELKQALSLVTATLDSTADGILVVNREGKIISHNQKFLHMWQIPRSVMDTRDDDQAILYVLDQLKDPEAFVKKVKDLYARPDAESYDILEFKDGRIIERYSQPQRIDGESVGRVWSFRDVTAREEAERLEGCVYRISEAANTSENLHELFHSIHEIVGELIPAQNFYISLYDQVTGLISFPYFVDQFDEPPAPRKQKKGLTEYVLRTGRALLAPPPVQQELAAKGEADVIGSPPVDWLGVPLNTNERTIGVLVVQSYTEGVRFHEKERNILTFVSEQVAMAIERKRNEEALLESEERFRKVFKEGSVGMALVGPDLRLLDVNDALCRMLGYTKDDLTRMTFPAITLPEDLTLDLEQARKLFRGELMSYQIEKRLVAKNKEILWTLLTSSLLRDAEGTPLYGVSFVENITERKRAEREILLLQNITLAVSKVEDLQSALHIVLKQVCETTGWSIGQAWIPRQDDSVLECSAAWYANDTRLEKFRRVSESAQFKKDQGLPGRVWSSKRPVWIQDITQDANLPRVEVAREVSLKAGVGIPVIVGDETIAVTEYFLRDPREEDERLIQLISSVAVQLGSVIYRKRVEEQLRTSEERFRSLVENSSDAIALVDSRGLILYAGPSTERIMGYRYDEFVGRIAFQFFHPEDRKKIMRQWGELLRVPGKRISAEARILHKDGSARWMEGVGTNLLDNPNIHAIVLNYREITERRKAEEALRESEEQYRRFFENDLTADFISTPDGRLLNCNPAFVRVFGFSSVEEALRCDLGTLYPDPHDRELMLRQLKRKGRLEYYESDLQRVDGKRIHAVENIIGRFNEQGELLDIQGYLFDDTKRKQLEHQLLQSQKMESLGTMAGGIAHDFNNILGIILGHTSLLEKDLQKPEKLSQRIVAISKAVQRGVTVVGQLLTFARKTDVFMESVNVNVIIEEITSLLSETFPKVITISSELDKNLPSIKADPNQVHQALLNLSVNARDAMPSGGTLLFRSSLLARTGLSERFPEARAEQYICISVSDTGMGIDEAARTRIFEPFFSTKERGKGTGLGLAVVHGIVGNHHGYIDVESEAGKGSTFLLFFPVQARSSESYAARKEKESEAPGGTETILFVEDEDLLRELTESVLEERGYTVLKATDGEEALKIYAKHRRTISVVLSDMGLPKLGGYDLFKKLKEIDPEVKVVLASGYVEPHIKAQLLADGAKKFVRKPYNPTELLKALREVLDAA